MNKLNRVLSYSLGFIGLITVLSVTYMVGGNVGSSHSIDQMHRHCAFSIPVQFPEDSNVYLCKRVTQEKI